ncbi:MAG: FlgO family outer membrane protein [Succinivibrionaceae bacterium]
MVARLKLIAITIGAIIGINGCSNVGKDVPQEVSKPEKVSVVDTPLVTEYHGERVKFYADNLVDKVAKSINIVQNVDKVAIATPVDIRSLENTDWLGRELAEAFVDSLHKRGFLVLEYKLKGWLEITKDGDYIYSRNWQKLASSAKVSRILSGTISRNDKGVMVYARLVNIQTLLVEGAADIFIPYSELPEFYSVGSQNCVNAYGVECNGQEINFLKNKTTKNKSSKVVKNKSKDVKLSKTAITTKSLGNKNTANSTTKTTTKKVVTTNSQSQRNKNIEKSNGYKAQEVTLATNDNTGTLFAPLTDKKSEVRKCHGNCQDPVIYGESTHKYGNFIVRDIGNQSQYDRH